MFLDLLFGEDYYWVVETNDGELMVVRDKINPTSTWSGHRLTVHRTIDGPLVDPVSAAKRLDFWKGRFK